MEEECEKQYTEILQSNLIVPHEVKTTVVLFLKSPGTEIYRQIFPENFKQEIQHKCRNAKSYSMSS